MKSVVFFFLLSVSVAATAQDGTGEHVERLGHYEDIDLTGGDMRNELTQVARIRGIEAEPDLGTVFVLVDNLLIRRALARDAERQNLIEPGELQARLDRQRDLWLAKASRDALIKPLSEDLLEQAAREIYIAHPDDYKTDAEADASHILIRKRAFERDRDASIKLVDELRAMLVDDPSLFEELAGSYSEDGKSGAEGGALGRKPVQSFVKPFGDAVKALKVGEISEPIETRFGFHIIRVNEHFPARLREFDEVKESLVRRVERERQKTAVDAYLATIRSSPDYRIDRDAVIEFYKKEYPESASRSGGLLSQPAASGAGQ